MDLIKEKLEEAIAFAQSIKSGFDKVIKSSPPGIITWQKEGGRDQYMHLHYQGGRRVRHGINRDTAIKKALSQKAFAQCAGKILTENLSILKDASGRIKAFDIDEILKSMPAAYSKFPESYFFDREEMVTQLHLSGEEQVRIMRHREWGQQDYRASTYHPEWKKHRTSQGLKVRSKSEALIMERLYYHGIDVRYEQELVFGNEQIAPDFTFEGEDGQLFIWEHLGMMDDPDYAARNYNKLFKYYKHGFVLGRNLIVSFDRDGMIDMKQIDSIIKNEVIPRL